MNLITGPWLLTDLDGKKKNGLTVFSCFCCGGGSSMGYKLAGFSVIGGCEIDPEMADIYERNIHPKMLFRMPIQEFRKKEHLKSLGVNTKQLLYNLDVLDGSPPCSVFSTAGNREEDWGKEREFKEGQAKQVLDDLFFHFISLAAELKPKVVVAENVKGLIMGNARGYVKQIFDAFDSAGYDTQLFLLNAARMGVPQARERVFFVATRKDLKLPKLKLSFTEEAIPVARAFAGLKDDGTGKPLTELARKYWRATAPGKSFSKAADGKWFNWFRLDPSKPSNTLPATCHHTHYDFPRFITFSEAKRIQSFPDDYDFGTADGRYVCGMSVPPLMMQRLAAELAKMLIKSKT